MSHDIDIIIKDGKIASEVKNIKGDSCTDIRKKLEAILGKAESEKKTDEYYQTVGVKTTRRIHQ